MLGTKGILKGARTKSPALNDFARLVATQLDDDTEVDCRTLATTVMTTAMSLKGGDGLDDGYAALQDYVASGGNMCQLAGQVSSIITAGASSDYAKRYASESKLYFGVSA